MKIFFTASVRGGRSEQPQYKTIVEMLRSYGDVFSEHVADDKLSHYGETYIDSYKLLERELGRLRESDVVVAELSTASAGVGYLIARATAQNKKVLALYKGKDTLRLSGIIKGDKKVTVHKYKNAQDLHSVFKDFLDSLQVNVTI